jgi:hypothetical protein
MITIAPVEPTYYEVSWGIGEQQRQTWIDSGDGSSVSDHARALAYRALVELHKNGRQAGLFVDGVHVDGYDFAEEWACAEASDAAEQTHPTTTFLDDHGTRLNWHKAQRVGISLAWASCSCGWKVLRDNRALARQAAKRHREQS